MTLHMSTTTDEALKRDRPTARSSPWLTVAVLATLITPVRASDAASPGDDGVVVVTHFDIAPAHSPGQSADDYIRAIRQATRDAAGLLGELRRDCRPAIGCERYDLLQQTDEPNHLTVVETWRTRAQYRAEVGGDLSRSVRARLAGILASPLDQRSHGRVVDHADRAGVNRE